MTTAPKKGRADVKQRAIYLSLGAAVATITLKFTAFVLTGSVGLLSDAAESLVNLVGASVALVALIIAARPADKTHSYGHNKAEYFSSTIEGSLIMVAAGAIGWAAVERLLHQQPLESLGLGLVVSMAATLINFVVAQILLRVGRKEDSIVLEADGKHLMTDVVTSVGVVGGLVLVWITGWLWLDPVVALLVAANIIFEGSKLIGRSVSGLMDRALPTEEEERIRAIIQQTLLVANGQNSDLLAAPLKYHGLRSRKSGNVRFVDLHLLTPDSWTVRQAHDQVECLEKALGGEFNSMKVLIHIEPLDDPRAYGDNWEDE
jgi:cation diffusion facilitator family transporter